MSSTNFIDFINLVSKVSLSPTNKILNIHLRLYPNQKIHINNNETCYKIELDKIYARKYLHKCRFRRKISQIIVDFI